MLRLVGDTARARGPIWTIETAARMLGTDKSRGYSLEMICADFLAGAPGQWQPGEPAQLDLPLLRVLALQQQQAFLENLREQGVMRTIRQKAAPSRLDPLSYESLRQQNPASRQLAVSILWHDVES